MQAEADLRRQQAEIRLLELTLRQTLADRYQHYLTALQHVQSFRTIILPSAQKRYELRLRSYQNARQDWPETLEAQKEFFQVRNEYVGQLVAWRQSLVELNGFVLTGGLTPPPGVTPPGHIDATAKPR